MVPGPINVLNKEHIFRFADRMVFISTNKFLFKLYWFIFLAYDWHVEVVYMTPYILLFIWEVERDRVSDREWRERERQRKEREVSSTGSLPKILVFFGLGHSHESETQSRSSHTVADDNGLEPLPYCSPRYTLVRHVNWGPRAGKGIYALQCGLWVL